MCGMTQKKKTGHPQAQQPLVLRYHRLLEAFSKSDDERDFYLDRVEGFILFINLDKTEEELVAAYQELKGDVNRYLSIPKLTYYEIKKFMEGFVHEKVYDIDTKEKLLDIIGAREARENFLEFIYDHLIELDKWQQYYHERSRIRIIEWLRNHQVRFVFEEDIDIAKETLEKCKEMLFEKSVSKELQQARSVLEAKAKTYYSTEALNPRPKRGRPPKQVQKVEWEPQFTDDFFITVPTVMRPFLFNPEFSAVATFSSKFETEEQLLASLKGTETKVDTKLEALSQRLESLRQISTRMQEEGLVSNIPEVERSASTAIPTVTEAAEEAGAPLSGLIQKVLPGQRQTKKDVAELLKEKKQKSKKTVTQIKATREKKKRK